MVLKKLSQQLLVKPGKKFELAKARPDRTCGFKDKDEAAKLVAKNQERMDELQ
ncbi:MAG: hypothetical protein QME74_06405 [Candidatus Edwardsbacteria bacterium]|nr:hypothetical protein [Candidatus Edwardsbacteria bacterium]